ncbi:MAG: alpha/beta hydrolase [Ilumatobacteraceae bacterium]|nr:alpha/beta hydrolase [Ilumatobacteraceae bacterium]
MTLHPRARAIVDHMAAVFPPPDPSISGTEMRQLIKERAGDVIPDAPEPVGEVADIEADGPNGAIPVRVYRPLDADPDEVLPLVVFFHGGGWVVCDLDSHDGFCRTLTNQSRCCVASVDYRLAPEHRFPVPVEDCYGALTWLARHADELRCDPDRISVAGDSAGGNLAAVVCLMARDRSGPTISSQVLMYPVIDHRFDTDSHTTQGTTNGLTSSEVQYYWREYLPDDGTADTAADDPYASPLRAQHFGELPRALLVLPEHDPLRSEGEAYGSALAAAEVPTIVTVYGGMFHSFLMFGGVLEAADAAVNQIASELRTALGVTS